MNLTTSSGSGFVDVGVGVGVVEVAEVDGKRGRSRASLQIVHDINDQRTTINDQRSTMIWPTVHLKPIQL
jgi:hypothetical protein